MKSELIHSYRAGADSDAPLALMIHGRAGDVRAMSPFARMIPASWAVVSVQAPFEDSIGGFSWWDIAASSQDKNSQKQASLDQLKHFIEGFATLQGINPQHMVALGFSQGAAILSLLLQERPAFFRGLALLSGFIEPRSVLASDSKADIFVAHGSIDLIVPLSRIKEGIEHLKAAGFSVSFIEEEVGHKVGVQGMRALKTWLEEL